jgi:hypothetical protein
MLSGTPVYKRGVGPGADVEGDARCPMIRFDTLYFVLDFSFWARRVTRSFLWGVSAGPADTTMGNGRHCNKTDGMAAWENVRAPAEAGGASTLLMDRDCEQLMVPCSLVSSSYWTTRGRSMIHTLSHIPLCHCRFELSQSKPLLR